MLNLSLMTAIKSLWNSPLNIEVQISSLAEGLQDKYHQRLLDLGLGPGRWVSCIRRTPFGGPRVFRVNDSVLSLEKEIAMAIFVQGDF